MADAKLFGPPRFERRGRMLLAGIRKRHTVARDLATVMQGVESQWQAFHLRKEAIRNSAGKDLYGILIRVVEGDVGFGYFCGIEVTKAANLPEGIAVLTIPPLRYAVFRHCGGVEDLPHTYFSIFGQVLPEAGLVVADASSGAPEFIERFDAAYDLETKTGGPEILIPLKD
jgi:AraC family transcriptional regulator